jgi:16S rRNA (cytosine1402-N4)-methyltransferase
MKEKLAQEDNIHIPVILDEVIDALSPKPGNFMIDGTFGGGGHSAEIAKRIAPKGTLLAVDRDSFAIKKADISDREIKVVLANANYVDIPEILTDKNLSKADGLLLDLGFSSNQLSGGRGFSFMEDKPLLMTYGDEDEPLYKVLPSLSKKKIKEIIAVTGERYAGRLAEEIWKAERKRPIGTTGELAEIIRSAVPPNYERGRINPATRTFLAFRIYINKELEGLEQVISSLPQILKPGGRVAIITFQSLEDRIVKNKFKDMAREGTITILNKKPLIPSLSEIKNNPRARSAKLRSAIMN